MSATLKSRSTSDYTNSTTATADRTTIVSTMSSNAPSTSINVLYTTGIHQEVMTFTSVAEKDLWDAEVLGIKADSAAVFEKKEREGVTANVRALYDQWMARIKAMKDSFGEEKVPQDIKWALNSAEQALGVDITKWENPPDATLFE